MSVAIDLNQQHRLWMGRCMSGGQSTTSGDNQLETVDRADDRRIPWFLLPKPSCAHGGQGLQRSCHNAAGYRPGPTVPVWKPWETRSRCAVWGCDGRSRKRVCWLSDRRWRAWPKRGPSISYMEGPRSLRSAIIMPLRARRVTGCDVNHPASRIPHAMSDLPTEPEHVDQIFLPSVVARARSEVPFAGFKNRPYLLREARVKQLIPPLYPRVL